MSDRSAPRRTFLAALATATSATLLAPLFVRQAFGAAEPPEVPQGTWDLSWLGEMKGKHRQVFDVVRKIEDIPGPLHTVSNYLDAWKDVYQLEFPLVNTVLGIAGSGFPINVNDAIWAKYKIAERWQIADGPTKSPDHNVFLEAPAKDPKRASVKGLQARGTIFCQCNKALKAIAVELAMASHDTADNVYAELVAGLNPGVRLVPANTMLLGLAQEHECAYESV
jgi:hypothetical protein